ncbi:hypothetical protein EIN_184990 [Entamoeba invadens IP1]|uniref:hypothetical protein n=1 Tax=Entamoeba invadens IP1 TaxID=370355 RepID=UPI0002C3D97B|nr:hypothetical protein EIN_184990 [Entamoeba invadens IP1]ELP94122.1 hypothetical protein EIN_184990 [Entamoeba invadens IP1]|eukprot:XP_004260893.1 hypothetical protein EIN_184990 [Entamoeba invadens IP1]
MEPNISKLFKEHDFDKDGLLSFQEAVLAVKPEDAATDCNEFLQNCLLILDTDDDNKITSKQFKTFYEINKQAKTAKTLQKLNFPNAEVPFPETDKLHLYFTCFEKNKKLQISSAQILHWARKLNNLQTKVFVETSLRNLTSNFCNEETFVNFFITPDAYIMEFCPKYIKVFQEIDLNKNGKIDIHEVMYHISKLFAVPETMRDFFTTVVSLWTPTATVN